MLASSLHDHVFFVAVAAEKEQPHRLRVRPVTVVTARGPDAVEAVGRCRISFHEVCSQDVFTGNIN